jgi:hypothetical protein
MLSETITGIHYRGTCFDSAVTPCYRVFFEKLTVIHLMNTFPTFMEHRFVPVGLKSPLYIRMLM